MSPSTRDRIALPALSLAAFGAATVVLLVVIFLLRESQLAFSHPGLVRFFSDAAWHPAEAAAPSEFGLAPMIAGSLLAALGAVLMAAPLGVLSAVYCQDYAPRPLATLYRRILELLAGIPSVVYGLWGLVVLVPLLRAALGPPGTSLLAAILILALMILPTVAVLSDAALAAVPFELRRAAAALGLSRARTVWSVLVPAARGGMAGAVLLATGRALGETLAVLMVCGNVVQLPASLLDPVRTLTANIALEMAYATGDHRAALFFCGLVLAATVGLLVLAAQALQRETAHD